MDCDVGTLGCAELSFLAVPFDSCDVSLEADEPFVAAAGAVTGVEVGEVALLPDEV